MNKQLLDIYSDYLISSFSYTTATWLSDVWFSSNDNMEHIKFKLKKEFVMPLRANRLVAFSKDGARQGQWKQVKETDIKSD